jgi:hypothetical protein
MRPMNETMQKARQNKMTLTSTRNACKFVKTIIACDSKKPTEFHRTSSTDGKKKKKKRHVAYWKIE